MNCKIENLHTAFSNMANSGWDTKSEMKWGYFFLDKNKEKLHDMFNEIKDRGYNLEKIEKTDDDSEWRLYMTKIETHTPESLNRRNEAMNRLAKHFSIDVYDGWDVEKIKN